MKEAESQNPSAGALLALAENALEGIVDDARREARLLLRLASGVADTVLLAFPERTFPLETVSHFQAMLLRRQAGEPLAHITGEREFWSLPLSVTADTLIPRPDTELLVSSVLECLPGHEQRLVDLGTGSGAIALALASERPQWQVSAIDRSEAALAVARRNGHRLGLNVEWLQGDWLAPVAGRRFHLIVSNPPYIPDQDPHLGRGDVRFEPREALAAGHDGLDAIRRIAQDSPACLEPGGFLLFEHGHDQGAAVRRLLHAAGFQGVRTRRDLAGHERVTLGQR
ncbi:peptide chain release factor N(5)-glutamine methyltransferase [Natronospira bacteriovora]|uniref:Release factor glutamine methyltransferase n=1 Tax=Natronospira bacteriovora TaxID=3069753 RepID=A0ABU0W449_9GAMM|nr:peptide chain release factor N(5)-glutamine methyltransferase [Natronospira sp. AB-CW4]MDQ2068747.1 peptide chain release factor N(5)-glutamine methyltransferase [Natronospira sp. AB-CW4]